MSGLILTRRPGESVLIAGGIRVTVLDNGGRRAARLQIEAPQGTTIVREEIASAEDAERLSEEVSSHD